MKIELKVFIVIISYIVAIIALFWGTNFYIENKTNKFWFQIEESFENFFRNQHKFVDTGYANRTVKYSQVSNPEAKPFLKNDLDSWNEKHFDIYKYFKIDDTHNGWNLFVATAYAGYYIVIYYIYPSYVGYRKQENSYIHEWIPSVETCINEAYDFCINNPQSQYIDYYQRGNSNRILDLIRNSQNEYFHWNPSKDKIQLSSTEGKIGTMGYMYDSYYRVFMESTKWETYEIERQNDVIESDKKNRKITGGVILTLVLLCFLIPMIIQNMRNEKKKREHEQEFEKKKKEPIYDKLKGLCNPANFMNPYDKEKVEKANYIYEQLMKTNSSDIEALKKLRRQAIDELNLNFINLEYIQDLKSQCNPERFLVPYDAEKVRIANEIYKKLIDNENNIDILEEVEKEIKENLS